METTPTPLPTSRLGSRFGVALILTAAVLWSTSALLASAPPLNSLPQESRGGIVAFWRAIFALALLLPMVRRPRFRWAMMPMVVCFAAMNWTFLTALMGGPPTNAIWLQNLAPAWVMLAGVLWLGEKPLRKDWILLGCCFAGVGLILAMQLTQPSTGGPLLVVDLFYLDYCIDSSTCEPAMALPRRFNEAYLWLTSEFI